jgi:hypothetical protein
LLEWIKARDGGHAAQIQDGIYAGSCVTGDARVVQETTKSVRSDPTLEGKAYHPNGRPQGAHTGYANHIAWVRGERLLAMAYNSAGNYTNTAPPRTDFAWPDRPGEKYELFGHDESVPNPGAGNEYPGCVMDELTNRLWTWNGMCRIEYMELNAKRRVWKLLLDLSEQSEQGHGVGMLFDPNRRLLVSAYARPSTVGGGYGIRTVHTVTGEFKIYPVTGEGSDLLMKPGGYTQFVCDWRTDKYILLASGVGWSRAAEMDPVAKKMKALPAIVPVPTPDSDGVMMGKAGYLPGMGVVCIPNGSIDIQCMKQEA